MRASAAKALGDLMTGYIEEIEGVVKLLIQNYNDYLIMTPPVYDEFGRITVEGVDNWEGRHGTTLAIRELASCMSTSVVSSFIQVININKE